MTRVRTLEVPAQTIKQVWRVGGVPTASTGFVANSGGFATISDFTHNVRLLGEGDQGGPMILNRNITKASLGRCFAGAGEGSQVYPRPSRILPGPSEPQRSDLYGAGGTAIARCLPTNPGFSLADSVAQSLNFRQAIPKAIGSSIWRSKVLNLKSAGEEYLNLEFGWLPLISDIRDVCHAVVNSHEILRNVERGSGFKTRTGYHYPTTSTDLVGSSALITSVDPKLSGWDAGPIVFNGQSTEAVWFSGCFTYVLPVPPGKMTEMDRYRSYADHVLGMKPTVENVWDAAPWSWAVDWAVNVGDVLHNISAFHNDSLIMQYGYIMKHIQNVQSWTAVGTNSTNKFSSRCTGCSLVNTSEWKVRYPASPYGFGLTYDGLSSVQKGILAAVGITHFG